MVRQRAEQLQGSLSWMADHTVPSRNCKWQTFFFRAKKKREKLSFARSLSLCTRDSHATPILTCLNFTIFSLRLIQSYIFTAQTVLLRVLGLWFFKRQLCWEERWAMLQRLRNVINGPFVFGKGVLVQRERPLLGPGQFQHVGTGRELCSNRRWKETHRTSHSPIAGATFKWETLTQTSQNHPKGKVAIIQHKNQEPWD